MNDVKMIALDLSVMAKGLKDRGLTEVQAHRMAMICSTLLKDGVGLMGEELVKALNPGVEKLDTLHALEAIKVLLQSSLQVAETAGKVMKSPELMQMAQAFGKQMIEETAAAEKMAESPMLDTAVQAESAASLERWKARGLSPDRADRVRYDGGALVRAAFDALPHIFTDEEIAKLFDGEKPKAVRVLLEECLEVAKGAEAIADRAMSDPVFMQAAMAMKQQQSKTQTDVQ